VLNGSEEPSNLPMSEYTYAACSSLLADPANILLLINLIDVVFNNSRRQTEISQRFIVGPSISSVNKSSSNSHNHVIGRNTE
jgi:hypothetical protein